MDSRSKPVDAHEGISVIRLRCWAGNRFLWKKTKNNEWLKEGWVYWFLWFIQATSSIHVIVETQIILLINVIQRTLVKTWVKFSSTRLHCKTRRRKLKRYGKPLKNASTWARKAIWSAAFNTRWAQSAWQTEKERCCWSRSFYLYAHGKGRSIEVMRRRTIQSEINEANPKYSI